MRKSGSNRASGNRDNAASSGSRCSNWNNSAWNSNWNIGLRAACDDDLKDKRLRCQGAGDRPFYCGQPVAAGFGKHTTRSGERRVRRERQKAAPAFMGQKHKHLFEQIASRDNLWLAYRRAAKGKRQSLGFLQFRQHEAANIDRIGQTLVSGEYQPGEPRRFMVYEPKAREISALPFADRVVQHALCNVIEPVFERIFLPQSYACRPGRGTHAAAIAVQSTLRRMLRAGADPWVLKTDYSKYFASVRRDVLHREFRRKLSCRRTLALLETIIPTDGVGLPIGNMTSQLAANLYGHIADRHLAHDIGLTRFARYMDDIVVIGHSQQAMCLLQANLSGFSDHEMGLHFSRWSVQHWSRGVNFVGYRIWPTHKLLRRSTVIRARRRITALCRKGDADGLDAFVAAWRGHAQWADSHNLINRLGLNP